MPYDQPNEDEVMEISEPETKELVPSIEDARESWKKMVAILESLDPINTPEQENELLDSMGDVIHFLNDVEGIGTTLTKSSFIEEIKHGVWSSDFKNLIDFKNGLIEDMKDFRWHEIHELNVKDPYTLYIFPNFNMNMEFSFNGKELECDISLEFRKGTYRKAKEDILFRLEILESEDL